MAEADSRDKVHHLVPHEDIHQAKAAPRRPAALHRPPERNGLPHRQDQQRELEGDGRNPRGERPAERALVRRGARVEQRLGDNLNFDCEGELDARDGAALEDEECEEEDEHGAAW